MDKQCILFIQINEEKTFFDFNEIDLALKGISENYLELIKIYEKIENKYAFNNIDDFIDFLSKNKVYVLEYIKRKLFRFNLQFGGFELIGVEDIKTKLKKIIEIFTINY